jgi:putative glutamine amidotransferase
VLNVVLGGSLYTHIAAQKRDPIKHDYYPDYPRNYLAHKVEVSADSKISKILSSPVVEVNSLHHQGVQNAAAGLKTVGFAPDGLIEAVEVPGHRFGIAVQWHPEWLTEQASMHQLFSAFAEAARNNILL